ncbi:MAG TPA: DUF2939 domain-containing protein [Caulobacteraceae bacterium]
MKLKFAAAALTAALVGACGADVKYDAAQDVHAFVTAAREGDRATFERHVDRPALRASLVSELTETLDREGAGGLAGVLGPRAVESAVDQMITPQAFSFAAEQGGLKRTPSAAEIATQLKDVGQGHVCLQANGVCALTFASREGVWKLVQIDTEGLQVTGAGARGLPMQEAWPGR